MVNRKSFNASSTRKKIKTLVGTGRRGNGKGRASTYGVVRGAASRPGGRYRKR